MRGRARFGLSLVALGVAGLHCVPKDAGYEPVRRMVTRRTGADAVWYEQSGSARAEERTQTLLGRPLSVDRAVQVALLNNQELQATFEQLAEGRAELQGALHAPNPRVEAGLGFHGGQAPDIRFEVTEDLLGLLSIPWRRGAAREELSAAELRVAGAVIDLAFEVRSAFYRAQASSQTIELWHQSLAVARAATEAARRLHEAGNITDLALAEEEARYAELRLLVSRAEMANVGARERLTVLMGLWRAGQEFELEPALTPLSNAPRDLASFELDALERRALERSLDISVAEKEHAAASAAADVATLDGWLPRVAAGVEAEREDDEWDVGPVVALDIPLFDQGEEMVAKAESRMRAHRWARSGAAVRIRSAARETALALESTLEGVRFYEETLLPLRRRALAETLLAYNAMGVGVFDLLDARQAELGAQRDHIEALRDHWLARAAYDQLLAGRVPSFIPMGGAVDPPHTGPAERHGGGGGH